MNYQDKTIKCRDCGKDFIFTGREQQFYAEKGFTNTPTRCKDCRTNRKKTVEKKDNQELFKINCKNCGKVGEMATEPRKPDDVMCTACFYEAFRKANGLAEVPRETDEEEHSGYSGVVHTTERDG